MCHRLVKYKLRVFILFQVDFSITEKVGTHTVKPTGAPASGERDGGSDGEEEDEDDIVIDNI